MEFKFNVEWPGKDRPISWGKVKNAIRDLDDGVIKLSSDGIPTEKIRLGIFRLAKAYHVRIETTVHNGAVYVRERLQD